LRRFAGKKKEHTHREREGEIRREREREREIGCKIEKERRGGEELH
jgi:hypothetical protein